VTPRPLGRRRSLQRKPRAQRLPISSTQYRTARHADRPQGGSSGTALHGRRRPSARAAERRGAGRSTRRLREERTMHAALVSLTIDPDQAPAAANALTRDILPKIRSAPGFVAGYWLEPVDGRGFSFVVLRPRGRHGDRFRRQATGQPPASASTRSTSGEWLPALSAARRDVSGVPSASARATGRRRREGACGVSGAGLTADAVGNGLVALLDGPGGQE
jgi:hypothetical protein